MVTPDEWLPGLRGGEVQLQRKEGAFGSDTVIHRTIVLFVTLLDKGSKSYHRAHSQLVNFIVCKL